MQRALCNSSTDQPCEKNGSMHICSLDHGHKGQSHYCRCGAFFISVKKSELEKPLQKVQ